MTACCDEVISSQQSSITIALVGNPNCGKTTLFNALTGARQRVGNWPGVTVERKSGFFTESDGKVTETVEVVDLPGIYSLTLACETAIDERIACEFILQNKVDVIINIVDASNLERHLYLCLQLLEMGAPLVLALNMMDIVRARKVNIDLLKLSQVLNCPVIPIEAKKGEGIQALKEAILSMPRMTSEAGMTKNAIRPFAYPEAVKHAIDQLAERLSSPDRSQQEAAFLATHLLEDNVLACNNVEASIRQQVRLLQNKINQTLGEDPDILIADTRYRTIQQLLKQCVTCASEVKSTWTSRIDRVVLNRVLGIPIFLGIMYMLFFFSINIGGAFQDFFDITSQTIFVDGLAHALTSMGLPTWLTALLSMGVGKGINTTITFIPVIGAMFLFLAFLEDSGYMARAAFVIDRFMRTLGLPGKAFVPMIVGFGCNVPAVMAARTLENKRDRILTIMMSPFMSCGARLAIYAVFTTAFFPTGGQNVVFALYLIGILMAILTGFMLRHTLLRGDPSPLLMELPLYHAPSLKTILLHTWQRLKGFVFRAGKLIVPICVLIGALNTINIDGTLGTGEGGAHSWLSIVGQWTTPLFAPMGIHSDNWPATVGLLTGILAKEVVVGTLNTLYTQLGHFSVATGDAFSFWGGIHEALASIPQNFVELAHAFSNPVLAKAPIHPMEQGVYGLMYQKFDGQAGAFAYLLFILLYFPCVSTTAAMLREAHYGWSIFSLGWMTGIAYGTAVIFYQAATLLQHPLSSLSWITAMLLLLFTTLWMIRWYAEHHSQSKSLQTDVLGESV